MADAEHQYISAEEWLTLVQDSPTYRTFEFEFPTYAISALERTVCTRTGPGKPGPSPHLWPATRASRLQSSI